MPVFITKYPHPHASSLLWWDCFTEDDASSDEPEGEGEDYAATLNIKQPRRPRQIRRRGNKWKFKCSKTI